MALPRRDCPSRCGAWVLRSDVGAGIGQSMWVLRPPWDLETIRRVGEVRGALGG